MSTDGIRWAPIDSSTEIVIEGFPRSANTYAVVAFRFAQSKKHRIAYRLHAPIQLILACQKNIPAIALIRKPKDTVLSWVIHRSDISIQDALKGYESFYKAILKYKENLVIADFEDITNNYGTIIRKVNEKYGTSFLEFGQSPENVDSCFSEIDKYYADSLGGTIPQNVVARPSQDRREMKKALENEYNDPTNNTLRLNAEKLYAELTRQ